MKVVINKCFGGFGLSEAAYLKLIEYGVPVRCYIEQQRDQKTGLYLPEPANEGVCIFDRSLTENPSELDKKTAELFGRYWESWASGDRTNELLIRVVEELGEAANGRHAKLKVLDIPFDSKDGWSIEEYDGFEHIAETHRTWG